MLFPVFCFSLKVNACWTGCPRFLACYREVEPRTPGSQEKKGKQPQRRAGVKSGPQKVQSRLYLQEKAHQVSQRLLAITSNGHRWASFQSVPLGIQSKEQFQEGSLLVSCRSGTFGVWDGSITARCRGSRTRLCPAEIRTPASPARISRGFELKFQEGAGPSGPAQPDLRETTPALYPP